MTLDEFFAKFDVISDTPDAVSRMRSLVLRLAMRGRLVPQNPHDGDADSLLRDIAKRRANNIEERELPPENRWHEVPSSWRWVRLGSIGKIVGGGTPRSENPTYFSDTQGVPWLTPADLNGFSEKRIFRGRRFITPQGLAESSAQLLPQGSVLFSSRAPIGYVAIAGSDLATNQGFKTCVPFIRETNEYLYYYLMNAAARIDSEASGTTFREVSGKLVSQIPVALPPLAEQKRIVAKVDELMALCDRLEAQQKEREMRHVALARASLSRFADAPTAANLTFLFHKSYAIHPADLRKSILTLAVQGKLVPKGHKDRGTAMVSMEALVGRKNLKNGLSLVPTQNPSDFVCLPLSAMKGSTIECSVGKPIALSADRAQPYLVKRGDIFIMRGNGSKERVGIAGMVRSCPPNVLFPDLFIHVPLPTDKIDRDYFVMAWNSSLTRAKLESLAKTTSGIWKINHGHISECEIPLPPLTEQRRIVAKVDQLMALVDAFETQLAASRVTAARLLDAMVAALTGVSTGGAR